MIEFCPLCGNKLYIDNLRYTIYFCDCNISNGCGDFLLMLNKTEVFMLAYSIGDYNINCENGITKITNIERKCILRTPLIIPDSFSKNDLEKFANRLLDLAVYS